MSDAVVERFDRDKNHFHNDSEFGICHRQMSRGDYESEHLPIASQLRMSRTQNSSS